MTPEVDDVAPLAAGSRVPGRMGQVVSDMVRTMAVIGAVVAVLLAITWRPAPEPVREIDPMPVATAVADVVDYPVLVPQSDRWRATAARYEPTAESGAEPVWFTGGVWDGEETYAGVSQSRAASQQYLQEQTLGGVDAGTSRVGGRTWTRYSSPDQVSLVAQVGAATTVVSSSGSWDVVEQFAATLRPVR